MNQEKRQQERMAADYEVYLTYQGRSLIARSRDISPRGVGILTDEDLVSGEVVTVLVIVPQATLNVETRGTVRYCMANPHPDASRRSRAGIEFSQDLSNHLSLAGPVGGEHRYSASHSVSIAAEAEQCYRMISDFERYPEWAGVVTGVRLLDKDPAGRGRKVEFENNFFFIKIHYTNEYSYDDRALCLSWKNSGGDLLINLGRWSFRPQSSGQTSATFEITIGLNFPVSERLMNYLSHIVMRKTMRDFKNYVEKQAKSARAS